jgi:hypothetical protein
MAVEELDADILLQRADLAADGRLDRCSLSAAWVKEPASAAA